MDLIVLKVPPGKVPLLIEAIDFYIEDGKNPDRDAELRQLADWLRYRHSRWTAHHPIKRRK